MEQDRKRQPAPLSDGVYQSLSARIREGAYPSGRRLPSEMKLSGEFGVSRPIVREALERLRKEGMIQSRQGAGSLVIARFDGNLSFSPPETLADVQRCYEFRLTIEPDAAFLAALRREEASVEELRELTEELVRPNLSIIQREEVHYRFHSRVIEESKNRYFIASMRALREHIHIVTKIFTQSLVSKSPDNKRAIDDEHRAIYEAIRNQDAEEARALMRHHIKSSHDRLFGGGLMGLPL